MKTKSQFRYFVCLCQTVSLAGLMAPLVAHAQTPPFCVARPTELVSWWRGEGNASDQQGVANGVAQAGVSYVPGKVGQAFRFNGVSGLVTLGNNSPFRQSSAITYSFWVRLPSSSAGNPGGHAMGVATSSGHGSGGVIVAPSIITFSWTPLDPGNDTHIEAQNLSLPADEWIHVAVSVNFVGKAYAIYVNGAAVPATLYPNLNPNANWVPHQGFNSASQPDCIGGRFVNEQNYFNGDLDEVDVFSRALSAAEVRAISDAGSAGKCGPCVPAPSGLVGWWRGENNALDTANGNAGTLQGGLGFAPAKVGTGFSLDGVDDYVTFPQEVVFGYLATFGVWIKTTQAGGAVVDGGAGPNPAQWQSWRLSLDAQGRPRFDHSRNGVNEYASITGTSSVNDGLFHYLTVTTDQATKTIKLYVDGVEVASYTETDPNFTSWGYCDAGAQKLGKGDAYGLPAISLFTGILDEPELYDRPLVANEIVAIYNAAAAGKCVPACATPPSGLVSWWRGEDSAADSSGVNSGTLQNGATFATGLAGMAFSFDGTDDYVDLGTGIQIAGDITVAAWIKPAAVDCDWNHVGGNRSPTGDQDGWELLVFANGNPQFQVGSHGYALGDSNVRDGQWHHLAGVRSGGDFFIYVDGTLKGSGTGNAIPVPITGTPTFIGRTTSTVDVPCRRWNGLIDEVLLCNRALNQQEIAAIHAAGAASICPQQPPIITCPANITRQTDNPSGTAVTFAPTTSGGSGSVTVVCTPPTGSVFPIGTTTLNCTATDAAQQQATCSFTVTVNLSSACLNPPSGLVAWWRGEGNTLDAMNANNGTAFGTVGTAAGKVGQAWQFDDPSDYVQFPDGLANLRTADFSIEFWFKTTSTQLGHIFTKRSSCDYGNFIEVRLSGDGRLWFDLDEGAADTWTTIHSSSALNDGLFHHVAAVRNGIEMRLFIDGALVDSASCPHVLDINNAQPLRVGKSPCGSYSGLLDELSLYNRALSSTEVAALYGAGSAGKCISSGPLAISPTSANVFAGATIAFTASGGQPGYTFTLTGNNSGASLTASGLYTAGTVLGNDTVRVMDSLGGNAQATVTVYVPACTPPPSDLVAWWRGEGDATDVEGVNNGTLQNGATFASGIAGNAFSFDGVDDEVNIPSSSALSAWTGGEMTLEAWVYLPDWPAQDPSTGQNSRTIVAKASGSSYEFRIGVSTDGALGFNTWQELGANHAFAGGGMVDPGRWHHVAGVLKEGQFIRAYVDGSQVAESTSFQGAMTATPSPFHIGHRGDGQHLNGLVDEVTLYHRALTPSEIAAIYAAGSAGKCTSAGPTITCPANITRQTDNPAGTPVTFAPTTSGGSGSVTVVCAPLSGSVFPVGTTPVNCTATDTANRTATCSFNVTVNYSPGGTCPPTGAVAWYRAEGNAQDSIGNHDGELAGEGPYFGVGHSGGQAFSARGGDQIGTSARFAYVPGMDPLTALDFSGSSFTWETWAYPNWVDGNPILLEQGGEFSSAPYHGIRLRLVQDALFSADASIGGYIDSPNPSVISVPGAVRAGQWNHIVFVLDDANNEARLYANGVLVGSAVETRTASDFFIKDLVIGGPLYNPIYGFNGFLDDVVFYKRALTISEIRSRYTCGQTITCPPPSNGLVSWWRGEDNALDQLANNDGMASAVAYEDGRAGRAFRFNGASSFIQAQRQVENDFTLAAWMNSSIPSRTGSQFWQGDGFIYSDAPGAHYDFGTAILNGKFAFGVGFPDQTIQSITTVNSGEWIHVAAVRSGTFIRVYVNGVEEATHDTGISAPLNAQSLLYLGGNVNDSRYYNGLMDEVVVYSRALTAQEILALYQCSTTVPPTITCPATITDQSTDTAGKAVTFADPTASSPNGSVTVACTPPSGSLFPIGTTTVNCTATDPANQAATCNFTVTVSLSPDSQYVYFQNFENNSGTEWSPSSRTQGSAEFTWSSLRSGNSSLTLTLNNLVAATPYLLEFDLYVIDTWDGNDTFNGPDYFNVAIDGTQRFHETFSNSNGEPPDHPQTYPDTPEGGRRQIGFNSTAVDAIYRRIQIPFVAGSASAVIMFSGQGLEPIDNESWAVDNVGVRKRLNLTPASSTISPGGVVNFSGTGGSGALTYSIHQNNSGGTINASTGEYHAGNQCGVTDTVRVTDANNQTADATVTLSDTIPPVITACAPAQTVSAGIFCQAALPDLTSQVTATDNCGTASITQTPAAGTLLSPGAHAVILRATDAAGNYSTCEATVTISDTTPPVIAACAPAQLLSAGENCQAALPNLVSGISVTDNCGVQTRTQTPAPGTMLGLGSHTVTLRFADAAGNAATCERVVTVEDTLPPAITSCAPNVPMELRDHPSNPILCQKWIPDVTALVVTADNCSPVSISQNPAAGTLNSQGVKTVVVTVSDAAGNFSTCTTTLRDDPPAFRWFGTVRRSDGSPVVGQRVTLSLPPRGSRVATTDENGAYSFPDAPQNSVVVLLPLEGVYASAINGDVTTFPKIGECICKDREVNFIVNFRVRVSGRIVDTRGLGMVGWTVHIAPDDSPSVSLDATTDSTGNFLSSEINVAAGQTLRVTPTAVSGFDFTPVSRTITVGPDRLYSADFTAAPRVSNPTFGLPTDRIAFASVGITRVPPSPSYPNGRTLYFDNGTAVMNGDGTGYHWLGPAGEKHRSHAFSPDGTKIAYVVDWNGACERWIANADGSGRRFLSGYPLVADSISWSPDGARVAFVESYRFDSTQLDTFSPEGNSAGISTSYTPSIFTVADQFSWSPDGSKFAITQHGKSTAPSRLFAYDGTQDINRFGHRLGSLTPDIANPVTGSAIVQSHPSWSPDGRFLALDDANGSGIYVFDTVAQSARRLLPYGMLSHPTWSPDGNYIAYQDRHTAANTHHVMVSRVDGSEVFDLGLGDVASHSWGRRLTRPTPLGQNVEVEGGGATLNLSSVTSAGETTVDSLSSSTLPMPSGFFKVGGIAAYEITTTATVDGPITVCFQMPASVSASQFARLRILHGERNLLGQLVMKDRTILAPDSPAPNFSERTICARVASLSPFAVAEMVDTNLAQVTGVVLTTNGQPFAGVSLQIVSDSETNDVETLADGTFSIPNLDTNQTYSIIPRLQRIAFSPAQVTLGGTMGEVSVQFYAFELPPAAVPPISIARNERFGGMPAVSWPGDSFGFLLESSDSVNSTNWSPILELPFSTTNGAVVPIVPGGSQRFFRLRNP